MQFFKRSTAWTLILCLVLSFALAVGPMAAKVKGETETEIVDPYVYYYQPTAEQYPAYYERYARPYMLYSGHSVHHYAMEEGGYFPVRFFNVVNTDALIEDETKAPAGGYATTGAFCADAETYIVAGSAYRRMNLEDGYFNSNPDTAEGTVDARKIRAVLRNSMPNLADLPAFEKKINAYLTATYGDEAVLVSGLTGTQLTSATQAAIWHYANGFDFGAPYPYKGTDNFASWGADAVANISAKVSYPDYPTSYMDVANEFTVTNMSGVYQYLLSLPGEDSKEVVLTADAVSVAESIVSGSDSNCNLTVLIDIDGTVNGDDQLVFSVKCGDQTKTFSLGATNTLTKLENGLYAVSFAGVSQEDCAAVELVLSGEQVIDDVCFFEAKPTEETDARKTSQNLAGYGEGAAPVYSAVTVNVLEDISVLEITKVDDQTGNPLSGVAFDLYRKLDGEDLLVGSYVTDANGKITVSVTDTDEYYFVETKALAGYKPISGKLDAGEVPNSWNAGSLEVSKKLINTTPAQVGETFDFKLILDLSTAPVMGNGISWMTGEYIMGLLECSKELTWSASGDQLIAAFTLNADETVTVDGIPLGAAYTLEEIMTEEAREWFNVTTKVDDGSPRKGNTATGTVAAKNAVLFTNSVVTSEVKLSGLSVSKKLINTTPAQVGETFNFQITIDFSTADAYQSGTPWMNDAYLLGFINSSENLTWTAEDGKYIATFIVDADETVTIEGLAQGATYTVQEILTEEDREWFTVTSQIGDEDAAESDTVQSTVAEKNAVLFTNTVVTGIELSVGKLSVSKKLENATQAKAHEEFTFRITIDLAAADIYQDPAPWMYDEYLLDHIVSSKELTWTKVGVKKYAATFTLKSGEAIVIDGIALSTGYTLEEVLSDNDRGLYKVTTATTTNGGTTVTGATTLVGGRIAEDNEVIFTNKYLEKIPVTEDVSPTTPLVLCMLAVMVAAGLYLNKRRLIV